MEILRIVGSSVYMYPRLLPLIFNFNSPDRFPSKPSKIHSKFKKKGKRRYIFDTGQVVFKNFLEENAVDYAVGQHTRRWNTAKASDEEETIGSLMGERRKGEAGGGKESTRRERWRRKNRRKVEREGRLWLAMEWGPPGSTEGWVYFLPDSN